MHNRHVPVDNVNVIISLKRMKLVSSLLLLLIYCIKKGNLGKYHSYDTVY